MVDVMVIPAHHVQIVVHQAFARLCHQIWAQPFVAQSKIPPFHILIILEECVYVCYALKPVLFYKHDFDEMFGQMVYNITATGTFVESPNHTDDPA